MVTCGAPQGSILGPLLFLIYVNDIRSAVDCELFLYADDTALLVSSKCVFELGKLLSQLMSKSSTRLMESGHSLHFFPLIAILLKPDFLMLPALKLQYKVKPQ